MAYGPSDHYVEIFNITRLSDFVSVFPTRRGDWSPRRSSAAQLHGSLSPRSAEFKRLREQAGKGEDMPQAQVAMEVRKVSAQR